MTYKTFLKKLRETPRDWYFVGWKIRRGDNSTDGYQCPVAAAFGVTMDKVFQQEIKNLTAIVKSADLRTTPYPRIRRDLLEACGLAEAS